MATIVPLRRTTPDTPVSDIPGIGPKYEALLGKLGIETARDLLYHLPWRYDDTRSLTPLRELRAGEVQTARVYVEHVTAPRKSPRQRQTLVEARFSDDTGSATAIWFGPQWVHTRLRPHTWVVVSGKVKYARNGGLQFSNPQFEEASDDQQHVGTLAPVYHETAKLSSARLREWIAPIVNQVATQLPDVLPDEIRRDEDLLSLVDAMRAMHLPSSDDEFNRGRERFAFEDLFLMHLAAERARRRRLDSEGVVIQYDVETAREFASALPFKLTDAQRVAGHQILQDLAAPGPMNRLLQGDVGSGKTAVAALAALMTNRAGFQAAVMAPTEILARQHAATLDALLTPLGLPPRLLVGSTTERARHEIIAALAGGHNALIVGTHALIEDDVVMQNLGLAVVDEQHRFGVAQRQRLRQKSGVMPNFLAMTATPIPRSLTLTLYGDVEVSELREMPPGRIPIETRVVEPFERDTAYAFVREHVQSGRQVFVICPLIEESDKLGAKSATAEHERLQNTVFPDLRVELLHGRMPAREKEARMARFASGDADILVSTSVVEVGVDVPNATVMFIEGAERFGLAQLHQFRGRVGRGLHRSYCLLFQGGVDDEGSERLAEVAATNDGFALAELDLRNRGPGDYAGLRQHGLPEMQAADLLDLVMSQRAKDAAIRVLDDDPRLQQHPLLTEVLTRYGDVFDLD
ncbi:MAG: ATP-dependent DNA helicase RecG [Candidatus Dormibacteraeota bacterium]|nr:ATP-dependent DNA helicase RecG [Candidatus Dormibacteraeota bacterium]